MPREIVAGCQAMAADGFRESLAAEWAENLIGDAADDTVEAPRRAER
jgi:hypothetical protein